MSALPMMHTESLDLSSVREERDIVYGEAVVGYGTDKMRNRPLLMNVYLPSAERFPGPRPALVLSHGGAYHRGSKDTDEFEQDGSENTPMPEYCRRFAARGYVCFSVGYRLTQELPAPQALPIRRSRATVPRGRIDYVRELLGLPRASDDELLHGAEAVIADVAAAFRFVHRHATRWQIDADRMAIGGFSAGAVASIYATYALGVPAAAVISVSGGMDALDVDYYLHGTRGQPPALLFSSEHDLPGIADRSKAFSDMAEKRGLGMRHYFVPGKPHFYDHASPVKLQQSSLPGGPVDSRLELALIDFLDRSLCVPSVTTEMLEAFAQAWTRHDIETLMSFMSEDCIFHSSAGNDASGTRSVGREAVRKAFMNAWADITDASWTRARHFVSGARGVSEWTLLGTRKSDGKRIEVDGCDLFTFEGDKIRVKDSWRKQRP